MPRLRSLTALLLVLLAPSRPSAEPAPEPPAADEHPSRVAPLLVFADVDDDDDDGRPDGEAGRLTEASAAGVLWLDGATRAAGLRGSVARLIAGSAPWPGGRTSRRVGIQGLTAGEDQVVLDGVPRRIAVLEVLALDDAGARVDLARSHASISRVLPPPFESGGTRDSDALKFVLVGPLEDLPESLTLTSTRADGTALDEVPRVPLASAPCPSATPPLLACRSTPLFRATSDQIDRKHPSFSSSSIQAEVGGRLSASLGSRRVASIRVGGPRVTAVGPIDRLRARLRTHVLRGVAGGMPAIGGNDAGARALAAREVATAGGIWGQCGIHFGPPAPSEVTVRDPPPPHLLAIGCDFPLPASGGELRFSVTGRRVRVPTRAGEPPTEVAVRVARTLQGLGLDASVSANPRTARDAVRSADVLLRGPDGALLGFAQDGAAPLSSDPTLAACIGEVDLADGLDHFTDVNARAGTVEERTLVKAYDDGDPTTVDVFLIPAFGGAGRIGESFVDDEGAAIQNTVILDRASVRAGARSYVLAHELGHVLLDLPGHPDDYGVDRPSDLMDADAADPSIFGPRRLSLEECERAVRQSGPQTAIPLLTTWPLTAEKPLPGARGRSPNPRK
jgi:hypothetical protein